jgi:16S rRNA (guanine966-N2)-methyltransferase
VRVIAGTFRSRRLEEPGKLKIRPTSDRLRETLFNILGIAVADSLFVDLYAGTGAVGIEALSRGARQVIFVESGRQAARLVRGNLTGLKIQAGAELIEAEALAALEKLASRHVVADFIFLDPPYEKKREHVGVLEFLDSSHLLAPRGFAIVEHHRKTKLPDFLGRIERTRVVEQGDAALSFFRLAAAA